LQSVPAASTLEDVIANIFEDVTANIFDNVLLGQQFSNRWAAFTVRLRALLDFAEMTDSCAQVIEK
jgi:hypothetical protein